MSLKKLIALSLICSTSPLTAHEPTTRFDNMVVSATKIPETAFKAAASISTLDKQDLNRKQADRLHDLFKDMPGVEAGSGPRKAAEQINIRGFGQQRTIIRVDGGRQNFDFGHNGRLFLDPEFLAQVDVLRGAHSTTHGSGALGGVVNMDTIEATDFLNDKKEWGALGKIGYSTNEREKMGMGALYGRNADKTDLLVSAVTRKSDDVKPGKGPRLDLSRDKSLSLFGKINVHPSDEHHLAVSFMHFKNEHPTLSTPNLDQASRLSLSNITLALAQDSNFPVDRDTTQTMGSATYHLMPEDDKLVDFTARYFGSQTEIKDSIRKDFSTRFVRDDKTRLRTHGFDLYNVSHLPFWSDKAQLDWLYGVEYFTDQQRGCRNGVSRPQFPKARLNTTGYYTRMDLHLPYVTVSPGYRYDKYTTKKKEGSASLKRSFKKGSPSVALKIAPLDEIFFYGRYAQAFRGPSLSELYRTGVHFAARRPNLFVANPDLKPEFAKTFEAGIGVSFDNLALKNDHLQIKTGYFKTRAKNFIELNVDFRGGVTTISNASSVLIHGVEGELLYETQTVFAGASFATSKSKNYMTHLPLASLPPHKASTLLGTKIPSLDLEMGWRMVAHRTQKYSYNQQMMRTVTSPTAGYSTHDLFLSWAPQKWWAQDVVFAISVDNVGNKHYRKYLSNLPEQGRNIKFSISSKA